MDEVQQVLAEQVPTSPISYITLNLI